MPRRCLLAAALLCLCVCFAPADRAVAGGDGYPKGSPAIGVHPIGGTSHRLLTGIKSDPAMVRTFVIRYSGFPAAEVRVEERMD